MRGQFSGPPGVKGQTSTRHFYQFDLPKMIYNYSAFFPLFLAFKLFPTESRKDVVCVKGAGAVSNLR